MTIVGCCGGAGGASTSKGPWAVRLGDGVEMNGPDCAAGSGAVNCSTGLPASAPSSTAPPVTTVTTPTASGGQVPVPEPLARALDHLERVTRP